MLVISVPIVIKDFRERRIPNWTCGLLLGAGLAAGAFESGMSGLLMSLAGAAAGFAIFLIFYMLGGMGAGDLKLMAACGSLVGVSGVPIAAVLASMAGTALAIAAVVLGIVRRQRPEAIPYGPAIVAGAVLTLISKAG